MCKAGVARVRKIWLTRHGESAYNLAGKLGGDSPLSSRGEAYAALLPDVCRDWRKRAAKQRRSGQGEHPSALGLRQGGRRAERRRSQPPGRRHRAAAAADLADPLLRQHLAHRHELHVQAAHLSGFLGEPVAEDAQLRGQGLALVLVRSDVGQQPRVLLSQGLSRREGESGGKEQV